MEAYTPLASTPLASTNAVVEKRPEAPAKAEGRPLRTVPRMPSDRPTLWPPDELSLDMFFFRRVFHELHKHGFTDKDGKVHISILRNVSIRLMDALGKDGLSDTEPGFFTHGVSARKGKLSWKEVCQELKQEGHPKIQLNCAERIFVTLERADSSQLSSWLSVLMMVIIFVNLSLIVLQSLNEEECRFYLPWHLDESYPPGSPCGTTLQDVCLVVFSAEYFAKLVCCPFVRIELFDQDLLLSQAVPDPHSKDFTEKETLTKFGRVMKFLFTPSNIIDLLSIMPWWITMIVGRLQTMGSASILRVIRIARILRILKTGRYVQILQVLGAVIVTSGRSIIVLMLFISCVAFVAGVLLSGVEDDMFTSIPNSVYWAFSQLIGMKHAPLLGEKVTTPMGIVLLALVMSLKGVLWILPIGQIKSAFDSADKDARESQHMRDMMEYELTKPTWASWYGLDSSCRIHLDIMPVHDGKADTRRAARASMPTPLLCTRHVTETLTVPVLSGLRPSWQEMFFQDAALVVNLDWTPSENMAQCVPEGTLLVHVRSGMRFPGTEATRWSVKISVPVSFAGDSTQTREVWSSSGAGMPSWSGEACKFQVRWVQEESKSAPPPGSEAAVARQASLFSDPSPTSNRDSEEAAFRAEVLSLLGEQNKRLQALESQLASRR